MTQFTTSGTITCFDEDFDSFTVWGGGKGIGWVRGGG